MDPWGRLRHFKKNELRDLQNKKLHHFVTTYLYPFSPHYRKLFDDNKIDPKSIRTVKDLQRIPFTSKQDFVGEGKPKEYVLQPSKEKIRSHWPISRQVPLGLQSLIKGSKHVEYKLKKEYRPVFTTFTTGTTNKPVPFFYTNYDINNLYISGARMLSLFEAKENETIVNMFPYAPHLAFWQVVFGGFASCVMALSTGGGKVMGTKGNITAIANMKPVIIMGVPSYVYHVLREAKDSGVNLSSIKKIVLGASKITQAFKAKLAELVEEMGGSDVSVFGTYGFTEARCAWGESPTPLDQSSGYFLYADKEIFEVVDPETGEVKDEGEDGELVYTGIDARGSAVLRYRTGDFVKGGIVYKDFPGGKGQIQCISSDIVRLSNVKELQLSKIKGALVNLNHFDAILSDVELIKEWQIEIRKKNNDPYEVDELVVYVSTKDAADEQQLKEDIKKQISINTELTPNDVIFIPMEEMVKRLELETANKEKRIVDTRPKD